MMANINRWRLAISAFLTCACILFSTCSQATPAPSVSTYQIEVSNLRRQCSPEALNSFADCSGAFTLAEMAKHQKDQKTFAYACAAIESFLQIHKHWGNSSSILIEQGWLCELRGQQAKADGYYHQAWSAFKSEPPMNGPLMKLCCVLVRQGKTGEAATVVQQNAKHLTAEEYAQVVDAFFAAGQADTALRLARAQVNPAYSPDRFTPWSQLYALLKHKHADDEAAKLVKTAAGPPGTYHFTSSRVSVPEMAKFAEQEAEIWDLLGKPTLAKQCRDFGAQLMGLMKQ